MNLIQRLVGKAPPKPTVTRQQALQIYPIRNPGLEWEEDEEGIARAKLVRKNDLKTRLVAGLMNVPESRELRLDEVGSFVWQLCDGEHALNDIVEAMMEKYKLGRREVEVSLNEFMRMLAKRGLIVVAVPRAVVEGMDPAVVKSLGLTELEVLEDRQEEPPEANPETQ